MHHTTLRTIPSSQSRSWMAVLEEIGQYDFYHLPEYYQLHESRGEGEGWLLVYRQGDGVIALPLLVRKISDIPGLQEFDFVDATSVYGYPGPIANYPARANAKFLSSFHRALKAYAEQNRFVSIFSRLNPLLANQHLLQGLGEVIGLGDTISIDLVQTAEEQTRRYRKSDRYEIRRARREGIIAYRDAQWRRYDDFIRAYRDTMRKVNASEYYFFDRGYFERLSIALREHLHLFVAEKDETFCAGALFVHTNEIIQYHLAGSVQSCQKWAPSKLIIDEARVWGNAIGAKWLHLGGGVGSQADSLFRFKAGFSPDWHRFYVWKWIVNREAYNRLVEVRERWLGGHSNRSPSSYFPAYRGRT